MIRIVLTLCALFLLVPVAQAASFDCTKASTPFESAICDSPDASKQDEILAQAYATALGGLSKPAANQLKATQHDWLDFAARVCSDDAQPIADTYNDDQVQCLISTIKSRISSLEASRMLGGYRFYPLEQYLIEPDTNADSNEFTKVATKHFETVKIDREDDVAKAFNAMTAAMQQQYSDLFEKGSDKLAAGNTEEDVDTVTTVKSVTDYRITLETTDYSFGHGAAHGNYGISYAHFLVGENRPLEATDIFDGKGWEKRLGKLTIEKVKARLGDAYFSDAEADIPKIAADPSRWDFSQDGLTVQFEPYEVASYADGAVTVTIPWDELRDIMATSADEIATY